MSYFRFAAMIAVSTLVMFALMYLNTYALEHVFWSETRVYMALLMGAAMAMIMLSFMLGMYASRRINIGIYVGSVLVFAGALYLVRSQATVDGSSYMRAMIPHHSIAIMTSERAGMDDARVARLAEEIIAAQEREIAEMRYLIEELEGGRVEPAGDARPPAAIASAAAAIEGDVTAGLDPARMNGEEVRAGLGNGPVCEFRYVKHGRPVFAYRPGAEGVLKVSGSLVRLAPQAGAETGTQTFASPPLAFSIAVRGNLASGSGFAPARAVFTVGDELRAGYGGYLGCPG